MKCPQAIEPHQIQGGDFIHIFPVVQWLVKRVFERRAEIGDFNRAYALNQYDKQFGELPDEVKANYEINLNLFCFIQTKPASFKENVEDIRVMNIFGNKNEFLRN